MAELVAGPVLDGARARRAADARRPAASRAPPVRLRGALAPSRRFRTRRGRRLPRACPHRGVRCRGMPDGRREAERALDAGGARRRGRRPRRCRSERRVATSTRTGSTVAEWRPRSSAAQSRRRGAAMPEARPVYVTVDGRRCTGLAEPRLLLCDFLRHELGLTGVHVACEQGGCGACTIRLDGRLTLSCLLLAVQADGSSRSTRSKGSRRDGELHPIQQAFQARTASSAASARPGMLLTTQALLERRPRPDRRTRSASICRATSAAARATPASSRRCARPPGLLREEARHEQAVPRTWAGASRGRGPGAPARAAARYLDDVRLPGMLHVAFVRSPYAHARIVARATRRRRARWTASRSWSRAPTSPTSSGDRHRARRGPRPANVAPAAASRATASATSASRSPRVVAASRYARRGRVRAGRGRLRAARRR